MAKNKFTERLSALEVSNGPAGMSQAARVSDHVYEVLTNLLPSIPHAAHEALTSPVSSAARCEGTIYSWTRYEALGDRIEANCLTDHDREVLAALEQQTGAELRLLGCTATEYVLNEAGISRQLERYVSGQPVSPEFRKMMNDLPTSALGTHSGKLKPKWKA